MSAGTVIANDARRFGLPQRNAVFAVRALPRWTDLRRLFSIKTDCIGFKAVSVMNDRIPENALTASELMAAAWATVHSCDICSVQCCENFTEPVGDMQPCKRIDDLWLCPACQEIEAGPTERPAALPTTPEELAEFLAEVDLRR